MSDLAEFELFSPGKEFVGTFDLLGHVASTTPLNAHFYQGTTRGSPVGGASITITPRGIYGAFVQNSTLFSLDPTAAIDQDHVIEQLSWDNTTFTGWNMTGGGMATNGPTPQSSVAFVLTVLPLAESTYQTYAINWGDRIAAAYAAGRGMWESETAIYVQLDGIFGLNYDNPSILNCGSGHLDLGLHVFAPKLQNIVDNVGYSNAFALFHAIDGEPSLGGCAAQRHLINLNGGTMDTSAVEAIQGRYYCCGAYFPDLTSHLGLSVHHELSHLAGAAHSTDLNGCPFKSNNLMHPTAPFYCMDFWRDPIPQGQIRDYAWPILAPLP